MPYTSSYRRIYIGIFFVVLLSIILHYLGWLRFLEQGLYHIFVPISERIYTTQQSTKEQYNLLTNKNSFLQNYTSCLTELQQKQELESQNKLLSTENDEEIAKNMLGGQNIGGSAAANNALAAGALVGGVVGAGGAVTAAYLDGERDPKKLATAGVVGGTIGAASGAILQPSGVVAGIRAGATVGMIGGGLEGYFTTKLTNPNATSEQILDNTMIGSMVGGISGATAGGFSGAFFVAGATGYAAEAVAGMNGFASGLFANSFTQNLFNSAPTYPAPTLQQIQALDPTYKPPQFHIPQTPTNISGYAH
jgi:hypothetical protein